MDEGRVASLLFPSMDDLYGRIWSWLFLDTIKTYSSIYQIIQLSNKNMIRHNKTKLNKAKHISKHV